MTISDINYAIKSFKQLYIDSNEIEVLFLDELTETIEVKFIESGLVTFVTKASISDIRQHSKCMHIDELLIIRK